MTMKMPPSCENYSEFIESEEKYSQLIEWSDRDIFSQSFNDESFKMGFVSGPGLATDTIDFESIGLNKPDWFSGVNYEVRMVSKDRSRFNAVFIGAGKYRGLLVFRKEYENFRNDPFLKNVKFKKKRGRVGVVCYEGPR